MQTLTINFSYLFQFGVQNIRLEIFCYISLICAKKNYWCCQKSSTALCTVHAEVLNRAIQKCIRIRYHFLTILWIRGSYGKKGRKEKKKECRIGKLQHIKVCSSLDTLYPLEAVHTRTCKFEGVCFCLFQFWQAIPYNGLPNAQKHTKSSAGALYANYAAPNHMVLWYHAVWWLQTCCIWYMCLGLHIMPPAHV